MTIRDTLKRNLIYIIIIIGMGVCFINRWQLLDTVVAPDDTTVWYDVGAGTASQTWERKVDRAYYDSFSGKGADKRGHKGLFY